MTELSKVFGEKYQKNTSSFIAISIMVNLTEAKNSLKI